MAAIVLQCSMCGATQSAELFFGCGECGSLLHLVSPPNRPVPNPSRPGIWSGLGTLGVDDLTPVSLDEGRTPLLCAVDGREAHYIKFEGSNPTGSWKDRFHAVNATMARQLGYRGLSVVSTGNSALAAAAYANRSRLQLRVRLATRAPKTIVDAIRDFGFEVEFEDGEALDLRRDLIENGLFPATMSLPHDGVANPFGLEGYKTIAYEIFEQLGRVPDWVAVPVGCGDGLFGIAKGFDELMRWGVVTSVPRMLGVQSDQAAPLVAALAGGRTTTTRTEVGHTIALSIAVDSVGNHAIAAVRQTGGSAVAVSDSQISDALAVLRREGIAAEPSSAAAWAGVSSALSQSIISATDTVVAVVTSNAFRWAS